MMHDGARSKGGTMPQELQENVDRLLDEFMAQVDVLSQERHLQKGVARSQLPCDMLAVMDRESLYVVAQLRSENRSSTYIYNPDDSWTPQKVMNSAEWEFGFIDPFLIKFPASLVAEDSKRRRESLQKIASDHIDSEFARLMSLLSLLRTRPIFGSAPLAGGERTILLLLPSQEKLDGNKKAIIEAADTAKSESVIADDIRKGKSAVRELWLSINEAKIVVADLTGPDPGVMYGLGIAHTIGKETVLILPQGSNYLVDIPKTHRIEHQNSDNGYTKLKNDLLDLLKGLLEPMEGY
jgi:hypothetical protein